MFALRAFGKHLPYVKNIHKWTCHASFCTKSSSIIYSEYGDPKKVLEIHETELETVGQNGVIVKMLSSPVNPADLNMVQGVYPVKPKLPAIGGNEGVGEIVEVGSNVRSLRVGDWVIPSSSGWGTWKTSCVANETELLKIPNDISVVGAATLAVNPCTAYRMIKDFVMLSPGDAIIQNSGNSGVGQAVIQVASALGLKTINVVRDRPDLDSLVGYLKSLGADYVVTEEQLRKPETRETLKQFSKPKLALNCVGGKSSTELLRHLADNGTMVTYGGMSKQPVIIPTGSLIFKNIHIVGFWMTQWNVGHIEDPQRLEMLEELADMVRQGSLRPPTSELVYFDDYKEAIAQALEGYTAKQILVMDKSLL